MSTQCDDLKGATRPQPQVIRPENAKQLSRGNFISGAFHGDANRFHAAKRPPLPTTKFYYSYLEPGRQPSGEDVSHPIIELALKLLGS